MSRYKTKSLFGGDEVEGDQSGQVVRVAFDSGADSVFDYAVPDRLGEVGVGQRVEVPFGRGNKRKEAFCVEIVSEQDAKKSRSFKLKNVQRVIDEHTLLNGELMELARWISDYYVCPLGQVLAAMVPAAVKKGIGLKKTSYVYLVGGEDVKISSKKQQDIVDLLERVGAVSEETAFEKQALLEEADCGASPLKTLVKNGVVKLSHRVVIGGLGAIPEEFSLAKSKVVLNKEQREGLGKINEKIKAGGFGVTLLYGVTDSGKTELYIRAIETSIKKGKQAIVMLPEIALTAQTVERFSNRFERIAVMHCRLTAAQRNAQWLKIRSGQADVVIGARSAVFAPLERLGLVIVDEEHEGSYKQDTVPRYHGRDAAIKRAQLAGAHCVLGSATPSLESLVNCQRKKHYQLVELPKRVMDLPMPTMRLVDMTQACYGGGKSGVGLVSDELLAELKEVLGRGEQAILLLNRRGYSNFIFCPSCRHSLSCRNCDVTLTFHKRDGDFNKQDTVSGRHMDSGYAICHYCLAKTLVPQHCPLCGKKMTMIGVGSQRLAEELGHKLASARVCRVDSDSMESHEGGYYKLLRDFADRKIDVLAGTQILAKGLHFPNVTLVGIISADTALSLPDFRSNERTFQLISQVAGRAGRSAKHGVVIVQSFLAGSKTIGFAMRHDYKGFVRAELETRKKCGLPPYGRLAIIGMRDVKYDRLSAACEIVRQKVDEAIAKYGLEISVRGPMAATISRIQRYHRMQIIVQSKEAAALGRLFSVLRSGWGVSGSVKVMVDVDAINLL